jgi:hypothetical protein
LGNASALADELMPLSVSKIWGQQTENQEGTVQLTGNTYLNGKSEDLFWDADAMPSSFFQALFMKWNELAQLAAIVLVKETRWRICSVFWNSISRAQVSLSIMAFELQLSVYRSKPTRKRSSPESEAAVRQRWQNIPALGID